MRTDDQNSDTRAAFAKYVLVVGAVAVAAVALLAIVFSARGQDGGTIMQVFTAVVTLFGSWGGTVIAFYFGRDNYEAGSKQGNALAERLVSLSVPGWKTRKLRDSMRSMADAKSHLFKGKLEELPLDELRQAFDKVKPLARLPLVDEKGRVHCIVHLSTLDRYATRKPIPAGTTLQALLDDPELGPYLKNGFKTLKADDTLEAAKLLMDGIRECLDIIVTEDGRAESKALGWLTNNALLELARA